MNLKKIVFRTSATVLAMSALTIGTFAATAYNSPAEIYAALTNKSVETAVTEKSTSGKTYGQLAADAGVLDAFKAESLEMKKAQVQQKVANGSLTQAEADALVAAMTANQENCTGTPSGDKLGQAMGLSLGYGKGTGTAAGTGNGYKGSNGLKDGTGAGKGLRQGKGARSGARIHQ